MTIIDNIFAVLEKVVTKKAFVAFSIFVHICTLCIITDFLFHPQIYSFVLLFPKGCSYFYTEMYANRSNNIKPFKNTISYRIYLIKKFRKEHIDIPCMCFHCTCDFYRDYYMEKEDKQTNTTNQ